MSSTPWQGLAWRCGALILLVLLLVGCDKSIGPTQGSVRFEDGEPVQAGSIEFRSLDGGRRYASRIDPKGQFQPRDLYRRIGLPAGEYEVVVVQIVLTEDLALKDHRHGRTVPRRYADYYTSGLRTTVKAGQTEPIEIVIAAE